MNILPQHLKRNKGNTGAGLIEVLIAVLVTATILTAIATSLTASVRNTAEARYREYATNRSQQVIEYLRKHKFLQGWSTFRSEIAGKSYCLNTELQENGTQWMPTPVLGPLNDINCPYYTDTNVKGEFKRTLTVEVVSTEILKATVITRWKVGTANRNVTLVQEFTVYQ